ncbi:MAG TPA: alkane 1-monooxygenase, partial [Saprospiraceae bacterium]|nr:alkane 1-monooxygenase [Saprospiraceae bacterium]
ETSVNYCFSISVFVRKLPTINNPAVMKLHFIKYLPVFVVPLVVFCSLSANNIFSFFALFFIFFLVPAIELFTDGSARNLDQIEEMAVKEDKVYDYLLYIMVPLQFLLLWYFLNQIGNIYTPFYVKLGMTTAMGISCGVLGINVAHELGHRSNRFEQLLAKTLLLSSLYMHFFIEHNRGHHKNVATELDPASSRYGENVYSFYFRSITDGFLSAWRLEAKRLKKLNKKVLTFENEMIRFQIIQLSLCFCVFWFFGWAVLLYFISAALFGILMLETVNYIEHYGLTRQKNGDYFERTRPMHSWNSNHPLGRLLLFELSRHSDHHFLASRKYQILRHHDDSPQMPTGYAGMMMLALLPPMWFSVMNRRIKRFRMEGHGS